jgi:hypothetical protein
MYRRRRTTHVPLALVVYATTVRVLFGAAGLPAGPEREVTMIANRMRPLPHNRNELMASVTHRGRPFVGRSYLLLIDRENPLSCSREHF